MSSWHGCPCQEDTSQNENLHVIVSLELMSESSTIGQVRFNLTSKVLLICYCSSLNFNMNICNNSDTFFIQVLL
jgi:hypothetical protein